MEFTLPVQLIDETKAPVIKPQDITVYLPDELPDSETMIIKTMAVEQRPGYQAIIQRDIELPTAQVDACFVRKGTRVVVDPTKAAALLALFNYQPVTEAEG